MRYYGTCAEIFAPGLACVWPSLHIHIRAQTCMKLNKGFGKLQHFCDIYGLAPGLACVWPSLHIHIRAQTCMKLNKGFGKLQHFCDIYGG